MLCDFVSIDEALPALVANELPGRHIDCEIFFRLRNFFHQITFVGRPVGHLILFLNNNLIKLLSDWIHFNVYYKKIFLFMFLHRAQEM